MGDRVIGVSLYSPRVTETLKSRMILDAAQAALHVSGNAIYPYLMQVAKSLPSLLPSN
jgi:hypothetical protein